MTTKECVVKLHLYPSSTDCQIPGITCYGEDIEFNGNYRSKLVQCMQQTVLSKCPLLHLDSDNSVQETMLVRLVFVDDDSCIEFVVNILTDSNPAPQRNVNDCNKRYIAFINHEIGQQWWISSIDLPDGSIVNDDTISLDTCEKVCNSISLVLDELIKLNPEVDFSKQSEYRKAELSSLVNCLV